MNLKSCSWMLAATFALGGSLAAQTPPLRQPLVWHVNRLDRLGDQPVEVLGAPRVVETTAGPAVEFDGKQDGLILDMNPLAHLREFTIEVVFRPLPGGPREQRFLHFQDADADNRLLFETRLTEGGQWFLDTFVKSGDHNATLFAEKFPHPLGPWYHAAVVMQDGTLRHYVNGQEELSAALPFQPLRPGRTSLGVRQNRVSWYRGLIRQVRITPQALAPREFLRVDEN